MVHSIFRCPACGHSLRVPDDQPVNTRTCTACGEVFEGAPAVRVRRDIPDPRPDPAEPSLLVRLGQKAGADQALMLDGAIGGAFGGVLAGVLVGAAAGWTHSAAGTSVGGAVGGVLSGLLTGFIAGVGYGIVAGLGLGHWGRSRLTPRQTAVLGGVLTGSTVSLMVGGWSWIPVGAALGAGGGLLWARLVAWTDSTLLHPEEPAPAARDRSIDLADSRWEIENSPDRRVGRRPHTEEASHNPDRPHPRPRARPSSSQWV